MNLYKKKGTQRAYTKQLTLIVRSSGSKTRPIYVIYWNSGSRGYEVPAQTKAQPAPSVSAHSSIDHFLPPPSCYSLPRALLFTGPDAYFMPRGGFRVKALPFTTLVSTRFFLTCKNKQLLN